MTNSIPDLIQRRHKDSPDYDVEVWITGVRVPDGMVHWNVYVEGEDDSELAAGILERAASILRDDDSKERAFNTDVFDT